MKEYQHATKRSLLVEKQTDFSDQKCVDLQNEKCLSGVTKLHGHQTESYFLCFALGRLISITGVAYYVVFNPRWCIGIGVVYVYV